MNPEYFSKFMKSKQGEEEIFQTTAERDMEMILNGCYESSAAIKTQLKRAGRAMLSYCDDLGESINLSSRLIYSSEERTQNMEKMISLFGSYMEKSRSNDILASILERESAEIKTVLKLERNSKEMKKEDKKTMLYSLISAYSSFYSFLGEEGQYEINLKAMAAEIKQANFKNLNLEYFALNSELINATPSIAEAYNKIVSFLSNNAERNSKVVLSAKRIGTDLKCEAWCDSNSMRGQIIPTAEMIKSDWKLLLAEYLVNKNYSSLVITPSERSYLDIFFILKNSSGGGLKCQ